MRWAYNLRVATERMRLFIAAPVPAAWHPRLREAQLELEQALPGYFRWTHPDSWHLTVLFLGAQPSTALPVIGEAITRIAAYTPRFILSALDVGAPGQLDQPRLVWLRCAERGVLSEAQRRLVEQLRELELETPRFKAHVTLGRARKPHRVDFREAVAKQNHGPRPPDAEVATLILYRSYLERTGAHYEPLIECELA
jgi:2'-5' RNA ligase